MKYLIGIIIGIVLILSIGKVYAEQVNYMSVVDSILLPNSRTVYKIWDSKSKVNCYTTDGVQAVAISCVK